MAQLIMRFIEWLIIPLIIWFITFMFERRSKRNKYEEMYSHVFAPLERIKKKSPNISDFNYISAVSEILFDKDKYGFVPVKLFDNFYQMENGESNAVNNFERIMGNNTNELRQLQGMSTQFRDGYSKKEIYVKRKSNVTLILTILLMIIVSAWVAMLVMYPDFTAEVAKLFSKIELFGLLFSVSFLCLALSFGCAWGTVRAIVEVRDRNGWKNRLKIIFISIVLFLAMVMATVFIMRGLEKELNKYDSVTLEKIPTSQVSAPTADISE